MKKLQNYNWLLYTIFILGIGLRVIYIGKVPGGIHRDEAYAAWNALSLFHDGIDSAGHSFPIYFEAWAHGQNALNSYLMLPFIALAGGHINNLIIRLPQIILSIVTLFAVYTISKKLCTYKVALWSTFLLAICPWHIMMSRWGLESNLAPGFLMLGLCCFILAWDKPFWYVLSAICYGLSLYCYAIIWPIVPVLISLQLIYGIWFKKIKFHKWIMVAGIVLVALATPLILFLLVNMEVLPDLKIGCFSIYKMSEFRSNELAHSFGDIWNNIKNVGYLLKNQDVGRPYDVIMPYGFFYDVGRVFIVVGVVVVLYRMIRSFMKRTYIGETMIVFQLIGAGLVGCMTTVNMTQINCLYIPLVICEAIGISAVIDGVKKLLLIKMSSQKVSLIVYGIIVGLIGVYTVNLFGFQNSYYTEYKELVSDHFQEGADDAARYALEQSEEKGMDIYVNAGLKYPNILLATETTAKEYLDTISYSEYKPAPSFFSKNGITFYMGIDNENIKEQHIYVIYYTELEEFQNYNIEEFHDWYVAVPK